MKRDPMTRQRSVWEPSPDLTVAFRKVGAEPDAEAYTRNVGDGQLVAVVGTIPGQGRHLSVTHKLHNGAPGRYPTWDEIAHAREELLPADRAYAIHLPRTDGDEYVAVFATTFHLHELPGPGVVEVGGAWWRVLFGTREDGSLSADHAGRLVCRLEPVDADPDEDVYIGELPETITTPTETP